MSLIGIAGTPTSGCSPCEAAARARAAGQIEDTTPQDAVLRELAVPKTRCYLFCAGALVAGLAIGYFAGSKK